MNPPTALLERVTASSEVNPMSMIGSNFRTQIIVSRFAVILALSMGLTSCNARSNDATEDLPMTSKKATSGSAISPSTGLRITPSSYIEDLKGDYHLCILSAAKPDPIGRDIGVVIMPLKPEDATTMLKNQYVDNDDADNPYPKIDLHASRAIALAISGKDYAEFNGNVGIVPRKSDLKTRQYVVIVKNKWLVRLNIPSNYIEAKVIEGLAKDIVYLIELGDVRCQ